MHGAYCTCWNIKLQGFPMRYLMLIAVSPLAVSGLATSRATLARAKLIGATPATSAKVSNVHALFLTFLEALSASN